MSNQNDSGCARLFSLAVHEFRTPLTVVAGYIRMLLKDRAGALNDQQRRLLEGAESSCGRLSALVAEMSDLSNLEAETASFNLSHLDLRALLADAIAGLPELPDRQVAVTLASSDGAAMIHGDPVRLKMAFTSIMNALRREVVDDTPLLVRERAADLQGKAASRISFAAADQIEALEAASPKDLGIFDEWRGGCGLSLPVARRIVSRHGGTMWSPANAPKAGAVVLLPHA